ncbi:MAG TPA: Na+/H+ antiporter subunit E [Steroidobacteraceae bacterium]|nr:Na+/H+ antiporter subunit E [Steroidobacteraceae bacterium]
MRSVATFLVLAAVWVLWSGLLTPLLLALGTVSCLLVLYLAHRMGFFDRDVYPLHLAPRLPGYWGWLLKEITRSNLSVARIVLDPKLPISPTVVEFEAKTRDPVGLAILGNSITLTPGSLTLDVHQGCLRVHCVTRESAEDVLSGEMDRRVARLVGE